MSAGADPASEKQVARSVDTFGELATEYLDGHAKVKKKSWREDKRILDAELLPNLKHVLLKDVKRREVRELIQ